jgi:outer membrane lipopolysaccharide assembly protein LptE/RlpB
MINRSLIIYLMMAVSLLAACSYRFVDPFPARDYELVEVRNSSAEPGVSTVLEEELRLAGGFSADAQSRLYVTVTRFGQETETVSSGGEPVRQKLTMVVAWKVEGSRRSEAVFGNETAVELYPWSPDPASMEWNRNAAKRLLARKAAELVILRLGNSP